MQSREYRLRRRIDALLTERDQSRRRISQLEEQVQRLRGQLSRAQRATRLSEHDLFRAHGVDG